MEEEQEKKEEEGVVQFTYHESLNAAPLRKCGRKGVLGGLIEQPRLAILAALATNPGQEQELGPFYQIPLSISPSTSLSLSFSSRIMCFPTASYL